MILHINLFNFKNNIWFFQSFFLLFISIPAKKIFPTILKYPALLLTPVFCVWSFGSPSRCTCNSQDHRLKISWTNTWGNQVVNTMVTLTMAVIAYWNRILKYREFNFLTFIFHKDFGLYFAFAFLALSWITLILIQNLPKFEQICCCNWCKKNCFPIFKETILDTDKPFELLKYQKA